MDGKTMQKVSRFGDNFGKQRFSLGIKPTQRLPDIVIRNIIAHENVKFNSSINIYTTKRQYLSALSI